MKNKTYNPTIVGSSQPEFNGRGELIGVSGNIRYAEVLDGWTADLYNRNMLGISGIESTAVESNIENNKWKRVEMVTDEKTHVAPTGRSNYPLIISNDRFERVEISAETVMNDDNWKAFITDLCRTREDIIGSCNLKTCNYCKYYRGVHGCKGHAPCSYYDIGGVMWDSSCSHFESWNKKEDYNV